MYGLFVRANVPIFPFILFGRLLAGIFIVFGIVRSVIVSCAGVAVLAGIWSGATDGGALIVS